MESPQLQESGFLCQFLAPLRCSSHRYNPRPLTKRSIIGFLTARQLTRFGRISSKERSNGQKTPVTTSGLRFTVAMCHHTKKQSGLRFRRKLEESSPALQTRGV